MPCGYGRGVWFSLTHYGLLVGVLMYWASFARRRIGLRPSVRSVEAARWLLPAVVVGAGVIALQVGPVLPDAGDAGRDGLVEIFQVVMAYSWVAAVMQAMPYLGISIRIDVGERDNVAAMLAATGAMTGVVLGVNGLLGSGQSFIVPIGLVSLAVFLGAWLCFELITKISQAVTIERDLGAGLRLGAFLCADGLLVRRMIADLGQQRTLGGVPFAVMVAAGLLLPAAAALERALAPRLTPERPGGRPPLGAYWLAALYLALALGYGALAP